MIEAGADVNVMDDSSRTPLHFCVQNGHSEVSRALIEAGADLNAEHLDSVVNGLLSGFDRTCAYGFSLAYRYIAEAEAAVTKGYLRPCGPCSMREQT